MCGGFFTPKQKTGESKRPICLNVRKTQDALLETRLDKDIEIAPHFAPTLLDFDIGAEV